MRRFNSYSLEQWNSINFNKIKKTLQEKSGKFKFASTTTDKMGLYGTNYNFEYFIGKTIIE